MVTQAENLVKGLPLEKVGAIGVYQLVLVLIITVAFVYIIKRLIDKIK